MPLSWSGLCDLFRVPFVEVAKHFRLQVDEALTAVLIEPKLNSIAIEKSVDGLTEIDWIVRAHLVLYL